MKCILLIPFLVISSVAESSFISDYFGVSATHPLITPTLAETNSTRILSSNEENSNSISTESSIERKKIRIRKPKPRPHPTKPLGSGGKKTGSKASGTLSKLLESMFPPTGGIINLPSQPPPYLYTNYAGYSQQYGQVNGQQPFQQPYDPAAPHQPIVQ